MENHYHDEHGVYTVSLPAGPDTLPPTNALRVPPPVRSGFWPVVNAAGDGWDLREDHRGRRGWLAGVETEIAELGPLPDDWRDAPSSDDLPIEEQRARAYRSEIDAIRDTAVSYLVEANGWRLAGRAGDERAALAKAKANFKLYVEKKQAIRDRYPRPDGEAVEGGAGGDLFYLTAAGTYHASGCSCTTAAGEWLSLEQVLERNPPARPCGRCRPPAREGTA